MTADVTQPRFSTTVAALRLRSWQLGPGRPTDVIDQFSEADFKVVVDDRADVHINSHDGRFYLGWFPDGRPGTAGVGWRIAVTGTAVVPGYGVSFDTQTPSPVVAAVLAGTRPL
ncbi:DUF317 domain-containing protein [Streptomyces sp. NPDC088789]|uniref:DUF317 domain-containing protein n=1 Tax=Streptomyces sp. NPDC088789 TaxID=3365899 RepID=UPI00382B8B60